MPAHEPHKVRTLTSDNGYKHIERQLGTTIYFATPHHAWERGTNENTNGLIRQYLSKESRSVISLRPTATRSPPISITVPARGVQKIERWLEFPMVVEESRSLA